jgi:hypothetical protein
MLFEFRILESESRDDSESPEFKFCTPPAEAENRYYAMLNIPASSTAQTKMPPAIPGWFNC